MSSSTRIPQGLRKGLHYGSRAIGQWVSGSQAEREPRPQLNGRVEIDCILVGDWRKESGGLYQAQLREQICHSATIHLGWVLCQAHRPVLRRLVGYGQIYTRTFVTVRRKAMDPSSRVGGMLGE